MLSELRPFLTGLVMPPTAPLLLIFLGLILIARRPRWGRILIGVGAGALWLLSCNAVGLWLNSYLLPTYPMASAEKLRVGEVQAIVVMGGGIEMDLPDGVSQLKKGALDRLRQGVQLARATNIPLMFTGGKGWGTKNSAETEAEVASRVAKDAFGLSLRWQESASRDSLENAQNTYKLLSAEGVKRIALVTDSWHMPRSLKHFEKVGFVVTPAPMGQPTNSLDPILQWLPTPGALEISRNVLREKLALLIS